MAVRTSLAELIAKIRLMIADLAGVSQQFSDQDIQDTLDSNRTDIRYENLTIAPSIVNNTLTNDQAQIVFSDYYSAYSWWESDMVFQAVAGGQAWVVVTPVVADYTSGHFAFEQNVFTSGTSVPGQLPPVFATGKIFDINATAADLLDFWSAVLAGSYDIAVDGQNLRRSQLMAAKQLLSKMYRRRAAPTTATMQRGDVLAPINSRQMRLLDQDDIVKGA